MNILFRADSSADIGTGHIMRDLVLTKKYPDSNIIFATRDLKGNINDKIVSAGYEVEILQSNNIDELLKLIWSFKIDMLVIDHYDINHLSEREIKEKTGIKILSFDDNYNRHYCDILLNHNIFADSKRYLGLVPENCVIQSGEKHTLLREEFIIEKERKAKSPKKIVNTRTVFVAMGGTDHSNINISILEVLKKIDNITVNIVTTNANRHLAELKKYVKDKKWIKLHINSTSVAQLIAESDLAIVTASLILNEVYYMEIPFIAIKTVENQIEMFKYLVDKGYDGIEKFDAHKLYELVRKNI